MKIKIPESWRIAKLNKGDKIYLLRMNEGLWKIAESNDLPYQVGIAMPLKHTIDNGFPTGEENIKLNEIEDYLLALFNKKKLSLIFAGSITGGGMREFVFYAPTQVKLHQFIGELSKEIGYNMQVNIQEDKEWNVFKTLCPPVNSDVRH